MLQKATFFCVNAASVSALFQLESRTSTTRGYSMNCRSNRSRYSRFSDVFLNDTGNWISSAPSLPSSASASSPSRVLISSSSVGRIVAADVPVLYLFNADYVYAYRKRLGGFAPNAFLPTWNAFAWQLR